MPDESNYLWIKGSAHVTHIFFIINGILYISWYIQTAIKYHNKPASVFDKAVKSLKQLFRLHLIWEY